MFWLCCYCHWKFILFSIFLSFFSSLWKLQTLSFFFQQNAIIEFYLEPSVPRETIRRSEIKTAVILDSFVLNWKRCCESDLLPIQSVLIEDDSPQLLQRAPATFIAAFDQELISKQAAGFRLHLFAPASLGACGPPEHILSHRHSTGALCVQRWTVR